MINHIRFIALISLITLACKKEEVDTPVSSLIDDWDLLIVHKVIPFSPRGTWGIEEKKVKWSFRNKNQLQITVDSDFDIIPFFSEDSLNPSTKDTTVTYQSIDSTHIELFGETYEYLIRENTLRLIRGTGTRVDRFYFRRE